jgi:hypothetical protein
MSKLQENLRLRMMWTALRLHDWNQDAAARSTLIRLAKQMIKE